MRKPQFFDREEEKDNIILFLLVKPTKKLPGLDIIEYYED